MKLIPLKITAVALAGLLAASSGAQATGLYDNDKTFPNFPSSTKAGYDHEEYCEEHPYTDGCEEYREERREHRHYKRKTYKKKKVVNHRCRALIRAVGKRNLVKAFARNSARFAWRRESRAVHGRAFANWRNADNAYISCDRHGALFSCTARGTPCKY